MATALEGSLGSDEGRTMAGHHFISYSGADARDFAFKLHDKLEDRLPDARRDLRRAGIGKTATVCRAAEGREGAVES